MSGVAKTIKKVFKPAIRAAKKVWANKTLRTAIIVGAIAFGGMAIAGVGPFAPGAAATVAPGSGMAAAGGVTNGTTFTTLTSSELTLGSGASELTIGSTAVAPGAAQGGIATAAEIVPTASSNIMTAGGVGTAEVAAGITQPVAGAESGGMINTMIEGGKEALTFAKENPITTMILGQGVSGAVSSYEARKLEDRNREQKNLEFNRRGTMGFNNRGTYAARPGMVANNMNTPDATQQQKVRSVKKNQLGDLYKQGLIGNQVA